MPVFHVSSPDDPRIDPFARIREKDLTAGHGGRFIVEGKVTLETLLMRSRFGVESLLLCETRLGPLAHLLKSVPANVPIYVAPQDVLDAIAGFPVHRGVLACGRKGEPLDPDALLRTATPPLLLLAGLSNHDNVGACFRNAAAFGAGAVLLDAQSCDPLYRKAIRVSSGASLWLPFAQSGRDLDMIRSVKSAGYVIWALTPRADAAPLTEMSRPEKLAILLGAEGPGLSAETIEACEPVRIPMAEGFDSVNVATAGAIALAHLMGSDA